MLCLNTDLGVLGSLSKGGALPLNSILLSTASSQYLSMSSANFGAYNFAKFTISTWIKITSFPGSSMGIFSHETSGSPRNIVYLTTSGKLAWDTFDSATYRNTLTTATLSAGSYIHLMFQYDSANATAGNRKRVWINGTEISSFDLDDIPTSAITTPTSNVSVGFVSGISTFNGNIYQMALISGNLPNISEVYSSGKKDIAAVTGIQSMLDVKGGVVTTDYALATVWTNNGGATSSGVIPT